MEYKIIYISEEEKAILINIIKDVIDYIVIDIDKAKEHDVDCEYPEHYLDVLIKLRDQIKS